MTVNGKTYDGSSAVDAGVQTVANGGTGVTTQADINKAFIGNLNTGEADVTDGTEFVSSYASDNGFAETVSGALNKPYRRKFSAVWNYIQLKISSVLRLTKDNYGGTAKNATTAGTATTAAKLGKNGDTGAPMTFNWSGLGGQPSWLWGGNDGSNMYVYNPSNFSVNTANKAGTADSATGITYTGENSGCISAYQTSESFNNSPADWASYIICNHGDGTTYYHQMLRLHFFSDTIQLQRRVSGKLQGWKNVAIMQNENNWSGRQNFTTAKASSKMVIPIGAPSSLEDGCIWIER